MPIAVAQALRFIIIALIQSGAFVLLMNVLEPVIDALKKLVRDTFGLSETDAMAYVANFILDTVELAGLTVVALKSRLPLKLADKLGFTARGYVRAPLPAKVSTGANAPGAVAAAAKSAGTPNQAALAQVMASAKGQTLSKVQAVVDTLFKAAALPVSMGFIVIGMIDWAAWNGSAYQGTFQKLFSIVGLNPDADWRKPKTVSEDIFGKVYNTYVLQGAGAIKDPYRMQTMIFSREALLDVVDKIGAELLVSKGSAPAKDVLAATTALVLFKNTSTSAGTSTSTGSSTSSGAGGSTSVSIAAIPKVFTGIVSQGVVGQGLVFTARPDDMIESAAELRDAAANNLAPYLNTLLGKIVYEVKVVSSVITKEGFKQTGTTQQIQTGTYSDGRPKYKTVTNKFATLVVYALTDKGTRAKLTTIVLGPTNSAKLTVAQNDLRELETKLPDLVTTTDIADIKGIETAGSITVSTPNTKKDEPLDPGAGYEKEGIALRKGSSTVKSLEKQGYKILNDPSRSTQVIAYKPLAGGSSASTPDTGPSVSSTSNNGPKAGASATTLSEWYQAQGKSLPSIEARSKVYADLGLGQSSFYAGTAEQNTKLLAALKAQ